MPRGPGKIQQKIMLLLLAGFALSMVRSPKKSTWIVKRVCKEWKNINRYAFNRAIRGLYQSKLVSRNENKDGYVTIVLTGAGKLKALTYQIEEMRINPMVKWDKKWRLVLFDIPENRKKARDILRFRLKKMGFCEFQKSVFISPYPCEDEVEYVSKIYNIRKFVRFIIAHSIDNELVFKKFFSL